MTKLTANGVDSITNVIFPSWQKACNSFLESEMHIFDCWEKACDSFLKNEIHILEFAKAYYDDVQKIPKIKEGFNIFTAIAEKYRYENLHSDLLKVILGSEKNNIRNQNIFYNFLEYIGISETEQKKYFPDYENIKFYREYPKGKEDAKDIKKYGFIDLLIYTETACIIIENKINGAPDRTNQLGKYYARMAQEGKKFIKIVYLTIDDKRKEPSNFGDYTPPYDTYVDDIRNKYLKHLPCVTKGKNKSFTKFLEKIINESKKDSIKLDKTEGVFIEQYKLLLEYIGGQVLMEQYKKDFIKDIMAEKDYIQTAKYFADNFKRIWDNKNTPGLLGREKNLVDTIKKNGYDEMAEDLAKNFTEMWNHRAGIIAEALIDDKKDIYPQMEIATDNSDVYQKKIENIPYDVYLYYASNNDKDNGYNIEFGFRPTVGSDGFKKDLAEKLKEAFKPLDDNKKSRFNLEPNGELDPDNEPEVKWVYAHVYDLEYLKYDEIKEELRTCLETLEKEATNVLCPKKKSKIFVARRFSQSKK